MATTNGTPALQKDDIEKEAEHIVNGADKDVAVNNWSQPGPAAFDFRSTLKPPRPNYPATMSNDIFQAM